MYKRFLVAIVICVAGIFSLAQPISAQPPKQPAGTQDGFVPLDPSEQREQIPAAPLVMTGYAVAWFIIFGYVWTIWQRFGKVERELAEVSRRASGGR